MAIKTYKPYTHSRRNMTGSALRRNYEEGAGKVSGSTG